MPVPVKIAEIEFRQKAILGEGPVWDDHSGKLYWVDILSGMLHLYDPRIRTNTSFEIGEPIGTAALREQGGLVIASQSGFSFYDPIKDEKIKIEDPESELSGNRFNDGKCDPGGRFWAGTMASDPVEGAGSLYCLHPDLTVELKLPEVTISNGLAWNRNSDRFFFIDTPTRNLYSFDYDKQTGNISNRSVVRVFGEDSGFPDGMTIDQEDFLWVAMYGGGKVVRIHPDHGEIIYEIQVPVPKPTCCTFGGSEMNELYITTCREHMTEKELQKFPLSGSLFKVKLPFSGFPPHRFAG